MELNDRDIDWQKEAPTLAALEKKIPFTVPEGYFEDLAGTVSARVHLEAMRSQNNAGLNVPEGYFEDLSTRIASRVALDRIRAITPTDGFVVPEGYFSELPGRINLRKDRAGKSTPVRRLITSWVTYAAAACITVMIATGIYFNSGSYNFSKQLSKVPEDEIINYLQAHSTPGDTPFIIENLDPVELELVVPDVSAEELEQYINSTTL